MRKVKNELMKHLKDRDLMNQRSQRMRMEALKVLKEICENGYTDEKKDVVYLTKKLRVKDPSEKKTNPKHNKCAAYYKECDVENREKSICRCMFYYDEKKTKCKSSCKLKRKWHHLNDGIEIIDYETPMEKKIDGVGNIDLRIKYKDKEYGVEVKPPKNNDETISRMVAEAMTYTIDFPNTIPAIAVFGPSPCIDYRGSSQYDEVKKLDAENNEAFQIIKKYIRIFVFEIIGNNDGVVDFIIKPYEK